MAVHLEIVRKNMRYDNCLVSIFNLLIYLCK